MSTVIVRPRARADLAEIWAYIANDSPDQADAFVDLIDSKFQALSRRPGLGRRRPELAPDVRSFPVGRHMWSSTSHSLVGSKSFACFTARVTLSQYLRTSSRPPGATQPALSLSKGGIPRPHRFWDFPAFVPLGSLRARLLHFS